MSVLENLVIGCEKLANLVIKWNDVREKVKEFCKKLNFTIRLDEVVENLSFGERQRVEILKLLLSGCKILILDELFI